MYGFCTLSTLIAFFGFLVQAFACPCPNRGKSSPRPTPSHSYCRSRNLTRGRVRMDCVGRLRAQVGPGVQGHRHVASQSTIFVQLLHIVGRLRIIAKGTIESARTRPPCNSINNFKMIHICSNIINYKMIYVQTIYNNKKGKIIHILDQVYCA